MNKRQEKGDLFIWVIWLDYEIMHFYGGFPIEKVSDLGITFQKIDNSVVCSHINKSGKLSTQIIGEKNSKSVNLENTILIHTSLHFNVLNSHYNFSSPFRLSVSFLLLFALFLGLIEFKLCFK